MVFVMISCITANDTYAAYKREQKGKRVAAADRRKQKAVVAAQLTATATDNTTVQPPAGTPTSSPHTVVAGTSTECPGRSGTAVRVGTIEEGEEEEEEEGVEAMKIDTVIVEQSSSAADSGPAVITSVS